MIADLEDIGRLPPSAASVCAGAAAVGRPFTRSRFAKIGLLPGLEDGGPTLFDRFDDSSHHMHTNHHMRTRRMATSPSDGVVNSDLRLFGIRNGCVCSGSVFTSGGFSNPTHTLIALAVRPAEHLAAQFKRGGALAASLA